MLQVYNNLLKMGLQKEVSGARLCQIAETLQDKKLSDYKARQKSDILLLKLDQLAQGKQDCPPNDSQCRPCKKMAFSCFYFYRVMAFKFIYKLTAFESRDAFLRESN